MPPATAIDLTVASGDTHTLTATGAAEFNDVIVEEGGTLEIPPSVTSLVVASLTVSGTVTMQQAADLDVVAPAFTVQAPGNVNLRHEGSTVSMRSHTVHVHAGATVSAYTLTWQVRANTLR